MNYDKLYKNFIKYCKSTSPRDRLQLRNNKDERLLKEHIYVENHHIIPTSVGGNNHSDNLVLLLPEEHLIAHKIRFKAYSLRQDMLAIRFILNGLSSKGHIDKVTGLQITKYIKKQYSWMRTSSAEFRLKHGWQTKSGIERISASRKGTMPVKDTISGKIIGSVSTCHPKVLSGEWVHHSKGRKLSKEHKKNLKSQKKEKNNNYKSFATKEFLLNFLNNNRHTSVNDTVYFSIKKFNDVLKEYVRKTYNTKIHANTILKNRFMSVENFINTYNQKYNDNIIYNPYYRSIEYKQTLSKVNKEKTNVKNYKT